IVPSWLIFKAMDVLGRLPVYGRTPLRLKSTPDEENLGLTFDDPTTRVGPALSHFYYLPEDVKKQLYDYLSLLTSMPIHIGRSLHKEAGKLLDAMKALPRRKKPRTSDLTRLSVLYDGLRQRIESVPDVLNRLKTSKGEPVELERVVQDVVGEYRKRYPYVTIT